MKAQRTQQTRQGCSYHIKRGLQMGGLLLIFSLIVGFIYQQVATARDRQAYPLRGKMVAVGDYSLHLSCKGQGAPTVIFEAGFGNGSIDWLDLQQELATETRVCSYDRAGIGWSEGAGKFLTVEEVAQNLHTVLQNADESGPYVLVGHSLGGIFIRDFYRQYPNEVSGLIFVDSAHENQSQHMAEVSEDPSATLDPMLAILRGCRLITPVGLFRLFGVSEAFFANIPYSTEQYAEITATTSKNGYCEAVQYEYELLQIFEQGEQALPDLGETPLIFLRNMATVEQVLAANESTDITVEDVEKSLQTVAELGQEIADLSTQGEWRPIFDTNHYIHLDKPEVVLTAIQDVLTAVSETDNK